MVGRAPSLPSVLLLHALRWASSCPVLPTHLGTAQHLAPATTLAQGERRTWHVRQRHEERCLVSMPSDVKSFFPGKCFPFPRGPLLFNREQELQRHTTDF